MADFEYDNYVTIGTPFNIPEENEPLPKASKVEDQIATDSKGRRRFHGAFTGGFSAGYFNTVGSKEGWTPSTFKSSRSKKDESEHNERVQYKPEDFMDEEDFAEHGIAPKKLKTALELSNVTNNEISNEKESFLRALNDGEIHSSLPDGSANLLIDMLAPPKHSIGIQLLNKMGWKQGQGVGEKFDLSTDKDGEISPVKKVYGCALPPTSKNTDSSNSFQMKLAPKDVKSVSFSKKDNFHGIGYSGIITSETRLRTTAENPAQSFRPTGKEKKGIRGQAFGIGVFEDEDDDIYGVSSLSNYDMTMTMDTDDKHGWTGSMSKPKTIKDCLPGFIKSIKKLNITVPPLTIQAPKEIPRHVFSDNTTTTTTPETSNYRTKLTSQDRSDLLGETTKSLDSVKHWTLKWDRQGEETMSTSNAKTPLEPSDVATKPQQKTSRWDKDVEIVKPKKNIPTSNEESLKEPHHENKSNVFQPFIRYPEKQARYEVYLDANKRSRKPELKYETLMTEWEKEQELAEFARAATMYKPLTSSMASRFVRANFVDSKDSNEKKVDDKPDDKKAAEMGMHGQLTRTTLDWHPDPILCKRMNIPHPYPNSRVKGVPSRNKKQTSFFSESYLDSKKSIELPDKNEIVMENIDNDDDEDDEFFSRIQKNKQKLLKSKTGPLSHLNIKIDSKKPSVSEDPSVLNKEESLETEKEVVVKPSIDIFKAIFENSDSEQSDTEQSFDDSTNPSNVDLSKTEKNNVSDNQTPDRQPEKNVEKNNISYSKKKGDTKVLPLAFLNHKEHSIDIQENLSNLDSKPVCFDDKATISNPRDRDTKDTYLNCENDSSEKSETNVKNLDSEPKHKRKKKEKKHRKHKTKRYSDDSDNEIDFKSKRKKEKESESRKSHKSKKKKKSKYKSDDDYEETKETSNTSKSKRYRKSSSSSEGSLTPSNAVLIEKLKRFPKARPKAVDFM